MPQALDPVPVLTPLPVTRTTDGKLQVIVQQSTNWVKWLNQIFTILRGTQIVLVTTNRTITVDDESAILVTSGTITLTLPAKSKAGSESYYIFDNGVGVITIAGNINGNPAGYTLSAQYKYVQVTSLDGVNWIVTANN